jgi:4-amino-4-deoxy-L-arabinose transferase-like glycosyltransferase
MFAHAHFAALDTFVALTWTAALLAAERAMGARRPIAAMAAAGLVWGLALLTKIHAWLLPPVVLALALTRGRSARTFVALGAWGASGLATFALGWPWLWYDTLARLRAYLGTGVERIPIRVEYFGRVYLDRAVPWHYPWVYFAVTVPIGLHALGLLGLGRAWRSRRDDPFPIVLAGTIAAVLVLFSTNVPVYDGERLFLLVFPLWAVLIGLGFDAAWRWAARRSWVRFAMAAALAGQGYGVVALHPFGLSYYNALVGGLPGAERLGLELTYWGDAVDPRLLDALAERARPGAVAAMVPTLHHIQGLASTTPALARRGIALRDESAAPRADWLVVYRRTAYWRPELRPLMARGRMAIVRARQGVWLSAAWDLTNPSPPPGTPTAGP